MERGPGGEAPLGRRCAGQFRAVLDQLGQGREHIIHIGLRAEQQRLREGDDLVVRRLLRHRAVWRVVVFRCRVVPTSERKAAAINVP